MEIPRPKQSFLSRLQNLPDGTKQKVMIIASIVIMIIVVWLWIGYFNTLIVSGAGQ